MAAPLSPANFYAQVGNGKVLLSWSLSVGATSYAINRSTDGVNFSQIALSASNSYLDSNVTMGISYFYQVAAINGSGTGPFTGAQSVIPVQVGGISLGALRQLCQQRADFVTSNYVSIPEWNSYISGSYKWLYNFLIQKFGNDYYVATPYTFLTDGISQSYSLPQDFYKLMGVEVSLNPASAQSWVTLKKFNFVQRNFWSGPNVYTLSGSTNLKYRLNGNNLMLVPLSQGGQTVRLWYAPRPAQLIADTDLIDGIAGYEELVVEDACIKALGKEETDTSLFERRKAELIKEVEDAAENRDVAEPETVSDSKSLSLGWGGRFEGDF